VRNLSEDITNESDRKKCQMFLLKVLNGIK
jgi:hypothetical protein